MSPAAASAPEAGRARRILAALRKAYPDARVPLNYRSPIELLVGTVLAAQCTDRKVNEITPGLFAKYPSIEALAAARAPDLERIVRPTGFYRNKARALKESAQDIVANHGGEVPSTMEELTALRGVGRKTAGVVLGYAFGKPAIVVDTHFIRLARRMRLTKEFDPERIERDVAALLPRGGWTAFSLLMTWHGRATCAARKPACDRCAVAALCPARATAGAIAWRVKSPKAPRRPGKEKGPGRSGRGPHARD
ncbi:MAG: endonuclease III [Candidatus Eisenbacteria bacterium]|nr:endonuclease III [Candidatus Eisenbacteria bacterium]